MYLRLFKIKTQLRHLNNPTWRGNKAERKKRRWTTPCIHYITYSTLTRPHWKLGQPHDIAHKEHCLLVRNNKLRNLFWTNQIMVWWLLLRLRSFCFFCIGKLVCYISEGRLNLRSFYHSNSYAPLPSNHQTNLWLCLKSFCDHQYVLYNNIYRD